jgi:predicted enzyme related to lactoylglutathione lyase
MEVVMSDQEQISLSRIGQIAVPVSDLKRAIEFYRDTLGIKFLFEVPKMAFFDCADMRLLLTLPEEAEADKQSSIIYFAVPEISSAHSILVERGVEFISEPHLVAKMPDHDLWMAFFRDSEGNTLALMSEVR